MWALIQFSDNPHRGFSLCKTSCWKLFSRLLISDSHDTTKNKHNIANIVLQFKQDTKIEGWVRARDSFLLFLMFWYTWKASFRCFRFLHCFSICICLYRRCKAVSVGRAYNSNNGIPVMEISETWLSIKEKPPAVSQFHKSRNRTLTLQHGRKWFIQLRLAH